MVSTSCGSSEKKQEVEGIKTPTTLNGPLGEYYDILSVNVRPFTEEETKDLKGLKGRLVGKCNFYKIIVEVKKNAKKFDFDATKIKYESSLSENDMNVFLIAGVVNNNDGEELEGIRFRGKDGAEALLLTCTNEGATKKFSGVFSIKKEEDNGDKSIELTSVLRTTASELEELKEGIKMMKEMKNSIEDEDEEADE